MLQAMIDMFELRGLSEVLLEKLVGLTTDGEAGNTGVKCGLWKRLKDHLSRDFLTFWCIAHRSDLAFESLETVSEFRHWKADISSLGRYYRASHYRMEALEMVAKTVEKTSQKFPRHHEVRFAEHLLNLVTTVLSNLPFMRQHWKNLIENDNIDKKEKQQANGFLKAWMIGSWNERMQLSWLTFYGTSRHCRKNHSAASSSCLTFC